MSIDRKFLSWVAGIIITTCAAFAFAEDRWNQAQELEAAVKAGNSNSYFIYGSIVRDLEDRSNDLEIKENKTPSEKKRLLELRQEIAAILEFKKQLLK